MSLLFGLILIITKYGMIWLINFIMVMMMLNTEQKKKKQIFFKILKEYNASFLFKEYFLKTNNNRTLDELIKKETNQPIYNILKQAFDWNNTNNPKLWYIIFNKMARYELREFINYIAIKDKLSHNETTLSQIFSPFD